jgi:hypothetical protein
MGKREFRKEGIYVTWSRQRRLMAEVVIPLPSNWDTDLCTLVESTQNYDTILVLSLRGHWLHSLGVLVQADTTKYSRLGDSYNRNLFLIPLEAESLRLRCWLIWFLVGFFSRANNSLLAVLTWPFLIVCRWREWYVSLPVLLRSPILLNWTHSSDLFKLLLETLSRNCPRNSVSKYTPNTD